MIRVRFLARFEQLFWLLVLLTLVVVVVGRAQSSESGRPGAPPPTRVEPVRETIHGVEVVDPYRWL